MIREGEDTTLLDDGSKVIQKKDGFRFGIDAILLAEFYEGNPKKRILEIGCGTGIISILLAKEGKARDIVALEIQEEMAELTRRNISIQNLDEIIEVVNQDVKKLSMGNTFDSIICNPPYMTVDGKRINEKDSKTISRHEVALNLKELIGNSKRLLKPRGSLSIIHRSYRLAEILVELESNNLSPKRIKFIHATEDSESNLVLVEASKGRKEKLVIEKPIYLDRR